MSLTFRRAIVVGASSGIGAEIARQLAAGGATVALIGRRADELRRVADEITKAGRGRALTAQHDVTVCEEVPDLLEKLIGELGGLDLLVYCAGNIFVPEESEYDFSRDRSLMEVNVIGAMAWTNPAAAYFEAQRSGTLVGLSSIAGERGRRTMPGYTTSKAALTAWFEALRNRVSRHGVNVVTVKPGMVDTAMTRNLVRKPMLIPAERAAKLILDVAARGGSPSAFVPGRWAVVAFVVRNLPSFIFRRLNL
jgi:decaprenylphospho-beta-D-erythro-pentofuranosid-2-ulose 2-reductase